MIRLGLLDDHEIIRTGLTRVFEQEADFCLVLQAGTSHELMRLLPEHELDVLVLDINLPDMSGIELAKQLKISRPEMALLFLSVHSPDHYGLRAMRAGACGFVSKTAPAGEIVDAVRRASLKDKKSTGEIPHDSSRELALHHGLSDREFELLLLLARGLTVGAASERMNVSINTANTYRRRILSKLHLSNNAGLVRYCLDNSLIE